MKRVFIFDLDDTLYDERTYVASGFRAVAKHLADRFQLDEESCFSLMDEHLKHFGRGRVFDTVLEHFKRYSRRLVNECVSVYRSHTPVLELLPDAARCLDRLKGQPLYIVTDGNKHVQFQKLQALKLYAGYGIRKCYITRRYGVSNEKPSPYCFMDICRKEQIHPNKAVYVGDNPIKDFVGIKPLGFRTVRIRRGAYQHHQLSADYEAHVTIDNLDQFDERLISEIFLT